MPKVIIGFYSGHNQPDFDSEACAQMVEACGANGAAFHHMTPWDSLMSVWKRMLNGRYDLTRLDPRWVEKDLKLSLAFAKRGLIKVDKYFDDYCRVKWRKYPGYPVKAHPFVENNAGINWGEDSRPIFNNWRKTGNKPEDFDWMWWKRFDPPTSDNIAEWEFHNKIGKGIKLYLDKRFEHDRICLDKFPQRTQIVRSYWNEAGFDYGVDGVYKGKGKEIDHRNLRALELMAMKAGAMKPRFDCAVDFVHKIELKTGGEDIYWKEQLKGYNLFLKPNGYLQEMHGIDSWDRLQLFYDKGFQPRHLLASSDGTPEKDEKDFYERNRKILKNLPDNAWFDFKMRVYENWNPKDTNENLEKNFPKFAKGIFEKTI